MRLVLVEAALRVAAVLIGPRKSIERRLGVLPQLILVPRPMPELGNNNGYKNGTFAVPKYSPSGVKLSADNGSV